MVTIRFSMVELIGIESNDNVAQIAQLICRTSIHLIPVKASSDGKMFDWNLIADHLNYLLALIVEEGH